MNKIKETSLLLQHLLSSNRRKKAKILVKEWSMRLSRLTKGNKDLKSNLPPDPEPNNWHMDETRAINANYFELGTVARVEDRILDEKNIHTQHDYVAQQLYGGITYTNESTHRSVFNRSGERVEKLSYTRTNSNAPSRQHLRVSRYVDGVTANLYGAIASAEGNYFHWFVDALARLFIIERFHPRDKIDQVLVPPLKYDFQWDSLAAFGFTRSQIIELQPLECLQFKCLLATSPPRGKGSAICPGWTIDKYNETLLKMAKDVPSVAGKQIYVSRRDAPNRMFSNEAEVCKYFESCGFDIVELKPLNLWQKIAVFRDADFIVSQTGAGLTNLMFCQPDVKVLELVDEKFVYPSYASLAVYKGGTHNAHFFNEEGPLNRANAMVAKSSLDINELKKALHAFRNG